MYAFLYTKSHTPNIHSVAVINHYSKHYWNPKKRVRQKGLKTFFRSFTLY